ncbi:MAG: hypothetical protein ACLQOZ_00945 [Acidimicrobiales bacterium]|jgi:hypothetical protein
MRPPRCFAYRTIGNPETYVVDLASVDLSAPSRLQDLQWEGDFTPVGV